MRSCFAGRTAFQRSHKSPRRVLPQLTCVQHAPAENTHHRRRLSRNVTPAALSAPESVLEEHASSTASIQALLERAVNVPVAERPSTAASSKRETLESPEELASTPQHRAIVGSAILLLVAIGSQGLSGIHSSYGAAGAVIAVSVAYILAGALSTVNAAALWLMMT